MAVYFFYGEEDYDIDSEIEKLKKGLDKNFIDMSFKTYDCPKASDLIPILRSQPMMFGKMLIVINCLDYFSKLHNEDLLDEIEKALKDNTDNVDIVFVAKLVRNDGRKLDGRKRFYKILKSFNSKEFSLIPTYKTAELESRILKFANEKDLKLDKSALTAIITQLGNNLRQIDKELDKVKLFAYPEKNINGKMIKEICVSNEDLFAFSDLLMENRKGEALKEYRKLLNSRYPLEILTTLQSMIRRWIVLKARSADFSPFELSKMTGMHEYVVKLTLKNLKNTPLKDLVKLKQNLTDTEYKIKSGLAGDIETEIENALFRG